MILPPSFEPLWGWRACRSASPGGLWFVFDRINLLISGPKNEPLIPEAPDADALPLPVTGVRFVGLLGDTACWAARAAGAAPEGYRLEGVRGLFNRLSDEMLAVAGRAVQTVEFDRTYHYCGVCATPTELHEGGRSRKCPNCGETVYPRVSPAMMVLIKRDTRFGRELLLARSPRFPGAMYSALAGFVEPSESIEDCIHREAFEEVGVKLGAVRYHGSQGWPFPHSLMIAFVAGLRQRRHRLPGRRDRRCAMGLFTLDALPQLPHRLSIARRLINHTIAEVAPDHQALNI